MDIYSQYNSLVICLYVFNFTESSCWLVTS